MRLRYKMVTYRFGADEASRHSVERHYRELMDELLRQSQQRSLGHLADQWRPPADIHETPGAILVKMELAGVREEDLDVTLYEDALVVSGRRDDDMDHSHEICYHEAQIRYGPFRAEVLLPGPIEREGAEAHLEHGFLRVTLPKAASWDGSRDADTTPQVERARRATHPLQAGAVGVSASPVASPVAWGARADGARDEHEYTPPGRKTWDARMLAAGE